MSPRPLPLLAALVLLTAPLSACGSGSAAQDAPGAAASASAAAPVTPGAALSVTDPWAKAADSGMTAAFGTLVNHTGADLTVVSATSPVAATVELHEVAEENGETKMQRKEGGFTVPAGGTHRLAPGGDHIMLMDLKQAVAPGTELPLTLTLTDGTTVDFTATVKEFSGANEEYPAGGHGGQRDGEHG